jgi:DeoR/GlpR family transcriptional regulator of sugar metabolism
MGAMRRSTRDRRGQVLDELLERKHVSVRGLAESMAVSESTVRRDLRALAQQREATLVHGGATLPRQVDHSFKTKQDRNADAKKVIGRLAADLVADHEQVFLDSGSTCMALVPHLAKKTGLCVLTHSLRVALEPFSATSSLILIGGQYRADRMDTVGPIAMRMLEQVHGYLAFVGADGLSREHGVMANDIESADLNRVVVGNARETVLLADQSKLSTTSLFRIVGWDRIGKLVTDAPPDPEWRAFLDDQAIDVIYPELLADEAPRR